MFRGVISVCVCLCLYERSRAKGEKELSFFHLGQLIPENQIPETIFVFLLFLCPFLTVSCSHTCSSFIPNASVLFTAPETPCWIVIVFLTGPLPCPFLHPCCEFTPPAVPDPSKVPCDYGTNQNASASQAKYTSQYHL